MKILKIFNKKQEDIVQNSVSFYNVKINPLKLTTEMCVKVKNNMDNILRDKLVDPDVADLATSYSNAFMELNKLVYEGEKLKEEKENRRKEVENIVFKEITKDRENREKEFFEKVKKIKEKERIDRNKDGLEEIENKYDKKRTKRKKSKAKREKNYNDYLKKQGVAET